MGEERERHVQLSGLMMVREMRQGVEDRIFRGDCSIFRTYGVGTIHGSGVQDVGIVQIPNINTALVKQQQ